MNKRHCQLIISLCASKLADLLISAKTTLPALMLAVGAPVWMVSWLVPIRESGALLPQALLGVWLRNMPARHKVWRIGMVLQFLAVTGIALAASTFDGVQAGYGILLGLILLSLGRSVCSLTMKDIQADIVSKGQRGKVLGMASTLSGVLTLCIAVPFTWWSNQLDKSLAVAIIAFASLSYLLGLLALISNRTEVESPSRQGDGIKWKVDSTVWRFIAVRGFFVHSALLAPYFMVQSEQDAMQLLPYFLAAQALATMLSSFMWGKIADRSARLTLQLSGGLALIACGLHYWLPGNSVYAAGVCFFVLALAHTGVRAGRKTYSLDVKEGQQRTELVAFSNTAIGIIMLAFGAGYALLAATTQIDIIAIMAVALLIGMLLTLILPAEKS